MPGKNTRELGGKPLFMHTADFVLENMRKNDELCISTNDEDVIAIAEANNISVPFRRPDHLAGDQSGTYEVLIHALDYYKSLGRHFDAVMLLQPTSPFRIKSDHRNVLDEFDKECDMVVTVRESKDNPYFMLFEENTSGFLEKSKKGDFERRQDCPPVYAYNGSMYLIRVSSLEKSKIYQFNKIKKVVMPESRSIDIDTMADWILAEYTLNINY